MPKAHGGADYTFGALTILVWFGSIKKHQIHVARSVSIAAIPFSHETTVLSTNALVGYKT